MNRNQLYKISEESLEDTSTSVTETLVKQIWFGFGELVATENPILREILKELDLSKRENQINPALEVPSERALSSAKTWIRWAFNNFSELSNPHIIVTGDGGIIVEWRMKNNFISLNFDEEDSEMDTILYKIRNTKDCVDFDKNLLEELFSEIISYEVISARTISPKRTKENIEKYGQISSTFIGSATSTNTSQQVLGYKW